jgi:TonB family protein
LPFKSSALLNNSALNYSLLIHSALVLLFFALFYFDEKVENKEIEFQVIEKFKVVKESKPAVVNIQKPKVKKKAVKKKRQVYGLSRKSMTSTSNATAVKKGNTVAKTPDNLKLKKDDEDSIPIPTDEFMITAMPKVVEEIRPNYPESAKKAGLQGRVIFDIIIDNKGIVRKADLVQGLNDELNQAAYEAMMKFRFRPAKMDKQTVAVKIKYAINFVLEK